MLSQEVTALVRGLNHPWFDAIQLLRELCIHLNSEMDENLKWNGPNFKHRGKDRITLRVSSSKLIQVILHLGPKTERMPTTPLLEKSQKFIEIKGNDRVILTFRSAREIVEQQQPIATILQQWIAVSEGY